MASGEPPKDSPATPSPRDRLAGRFATILAGYCVLIVALSAVRLYLQDWGLLVTRAENEVLYQLLLIHGVCVPVICIGAWALLLTNRPGKHGLRLLSILTPFFLLASVDRICAYFIPPIYGRTTLFLQDRELGWRHRPGAEGEWAGWVRINRQGYRGPEVAEEKAPDEFRILFLGDSVAFALRTDYEDSFVARIERALKERADMPVVTTVNMSVSGYSPWQEYICLKRQGLKFRPDLVVHCFCLNDVTEKFNLMRFGGDRIGFEAAMASTGLEWSGIYRFARRARVWLRFGTDVKKAVGEIADREVWDLVDRPDSEFVRNAWSVTKENMADIVQWCRDNDVPIAVVCFPYAFQLERSRETDHPQRVLQLFCEDRKVPFLNLLPSMRGYHADRGTEYPLFYDRNHPTIEGHAFVAEQILAFLEREGLLLSSATQSSDHE
ncbi:MAG: SGNH/GDSL hydrolase family protein [Phycisphaerales bacterium]|nr:MAG: SGNH/GDSL hydrolase family protein [Phycisphaerales bacterium]